MGTAAQENLDLLRHLLKKNETLEKEITGALEKVRFNQRCLSFAIDEMEKAANDFSASQQSCTPKDPDRFLNGYLAI